MTMKFPRIQMVDVNGLTELLSENLVPPEIASMMIFTYNGLILAYASQLPIDRLRRLAATYSAAYNTHGSFSEPQRSYDTSLDPMGGQPFSSSPCVDVPPMEHDGEEGSSEREVTGEPIVFDDGDVVAFVVGITDRVFLSVMSGSRQMLQEQERDSQVVGNERENDDYSTTKKRRLTSPVITSASPRTIKSDDYRNLPYHNGALSGGSPVPEASASGSLPNSLASSALSPFYAGRAGNVNTMQRTQTQDPWRLEGRDQPSTSYFDVSGTAAATHEALAQGLEEYKEQHDEQLGLLASVDMKVSAEGMWALQSKAEAMATFLRKRMAGLELPMMF